MNAQKRSTVTMNISFIGFGNMAQAIAQGLSLNKQYKLHAASPSLPCGVNEQGVSLYNDNSLVALNADVILLCVKPNKMNEVFQEIKSIISNKCLVISIAAGLSLDWFNKHGNPDLGIVRAMPNLASKIGKGATPMIHNSFVSPDQKINAQNLFNCVGISTWLDDEKEMDAFTALSGSGPAYIFLFIECLIKAATTLGIDKKNATLFAIQMVNGSMGLATQTPLAINELRQQITSKGGTTAAAIDVFNRMNLEGIVLDAMTAATKRAESLGT